MKRPSCEVIGCGGAASWVRQESAGSLYEAYLCNTCWMHLRISRGAEAQRYVPYDADESIRSCGCSTPGAIGEEVLVIG